MRSDVVSWPERQAGDAAGDVDVVAAFACLELLGSSSCFLPSFGMSRDTQRVDVMTGIDADQSLPSGSVGAAEVASSGFPCEVRGAQGALPEPPAGCSTCQVCS